MLMRYLLFSIHLKLLSLIFFQEHYSYENTVSSEQYYLSSPVSNIPLEYPLEEGKFCLFQKVRECKCITLIDREPTGNNRKGALFSGDTIFPWSPVISGTQN